MARMPISRRMALALMVAVAASFGCNPLLMPFYLFGGLTKTKVPSRFDFYDKAKAAKKKKDIKIVVLSYNGRSLSPDYLTAERTLSALFVNKLGEAFKSNKERVTVVPASEVEKFKRQHDDWRAMSFAEIGKQFGADYVIDMELANLSLFEPNSRDMFRGHCRIPITIIDIEKDLQEPFDSEIYELDYPGGGQSIPADLDTSPEKFQARFFAKIVVELTRLFTAIETKEQFRN